MKNSPTELANDPERLNVIFNSMRPGAKLFCVKLEYEHYDPLDEERNDQFVMVLQKWESLLMIIVSVPMKDKHIVESVAKETGMRLAGGTPFMVKSEGTIKILGNLRPDAIPDEYKKMANFFPMTTPNCFGLENEVNSLVYDGMVGAAHIAEYEEAKVEGIFAKFKERWLLAHPGEEYPKEYESI